MGYFVRQNASQLRLRLRRDNQPGVHPDVATRHGEGVDIAIIDRKKIKTEPGVVADRSETPPQLVQIGLDIGIIEIRWFAPANLMHDLLADFLLGAQRQIIAGSIPQLGQFIGRDRLQGQRAGEKGGDETLAQVHGAMIPQPRNRHSGPS